MFRLRRAGRYLYHNKKKLLNTIRKSNRTPKKNKKEMRYFSNSCFKKDSLAGGEFFTNARYCHFLLYMIAYSLMFVTMRWRKFLIARAKRTFKKVPNFGVFWVIVGRLAFIFKKGQNLRMGKGHGSFFSTRRVIRSGSVVCRVFSTHRSTLERFKSYVRSRMCGKVHTSYINSLDTNLTATQGVLFQNETQTTSGSYPLKLVELDFYKVMSTISRVRWKLLKTKIRKKKKIHFWKYTLDKVIKSIISAVYRKKYWNLITRSKFRNRKRYYNNWIFRIAQSAKISYRSKLRLETINFLYGYNNSIVYF